MNKATTNFWVDVVIGVAFIASAISGLVFLIPVDWLSASGNTLPHILGLPYRTWSTLHTYSSLAMMAGVAAHLALHARWIGCMARRTLLPKAPPAACERSDTKLTDRRELA
jgi:cytochrome b subunit of formate dehydrogenase